jgi:hypothetical protein
VTLKGDTIAVEFQAIVEGYVARRFGQKQGKCSPPGSEQRTIPIKAIV